MKLFMLKYNYPKMALLPHQQQRRSLMHQGLFFFLFFFRHILTNYINGKQMVTVNVAQFHHLLLVEPLKSKALCKDYSHTMIPAESERPCLDCVLSTCLYNDWYEEICFYNTHTKHTLEQKFIYGK